MRIQPNATPAAAPSRPAAVLSAASARTPAFRALFPQLRLLGRVLNDLRPQTPRWPMPTAPRRNEGPPADKFARPEGRGIPIRINSVDPGTPPKPLQLQPWHGSPLQPWCGTQLKPWKHLPHVFLPVMRVLAFACRVICDDMPRGRGVPIRIN